MCKIKSQDSLKTDLLTLLRKYVYTHRRRQIYKLNFIVEQLQKTL